VRILVVADVSPVRPAGGGERVLREQTRRLAAAGHAVRVVCRAPEEGAPEHTVLDGVSVRHVAVDRRSLAGLIRTSVLGVRAAVVREFRQHGADVLHVHQPLGGFGALTSVAGRQRPSLYTFHSPAPVEYRLRAGASRLHRPGLGGRAAAAVLGVVERACLLRAGRVHVLSEFSAGLLERLYGIGGARVVRIAGGADLARFRPPADRPALRRRLGLPLERPVLFTLRNLEPRMGLDRLVEALARLRRPGGPLLVIGGAGSLRGALERQAADLGLGADVRFLGFVPDEALPDWYGAADAVVLPTRALEGFGLVTVEALACGTPVLGTPVGATPEILGPLEPALLFRDAGAAAMAAGIEAFLDRARREPAALERLRRACREHAERRYGWEERAAELGTVLDALVREATCLACATPAATAGFRHRGRGYRCCRACGSATAAVVPEADALRRFYREAYPTRFGAGPDHPARRAVMSRIVAGLGPPAAARRLLDVGCGAGLLLEEAARAGWRPLGVEVADAPALAAAKRAGCPVLQADAVRLPVRDGALDALVLVNVLDHLADPAAALAEARRVLRPGGRIAVRVPNGALHARATRVLARLGPLARALGLDACPVLHVVALTPRGLRRLAERAGFAVTALRPSAPAAEAAGAPRWLRRVAAAAAAASRGRWLLAPSVECYGVRR
jgi:glycosyltransferase involved in cell wall biosynthesis/SAM-dependent methyltransferase